MTPALTPLAEALAEQLKARGQTVGVAESRPAG